MTPLGRLSGLSVLFSMLGLAPAAGAFPGFLAGKSKPPVVHSTHVALIKKGPVTVVSVMPDYQGSLEPFAMVLAVPADAGQEHVITLKREFVDRLDMLSAPRVWEFWEQDPCDQGPPEQEWQRDLKVKGMGFLGGGPMEGPGARKVEKELMLDTKSKQKEGEYKITVLEPGASPVAWLTSHGYAAPPRADEAVAPYVGQGMRFVVAEVDTKRVELVGGDRAQLSPIRFYTEQPYDTLPSRLGLLNLPPKGMQEIVVYVLDQEKRFQTANYTNYQPPTNIEVDFAVKERIGEFYNAIYDIILKKTPEAFLLEYAWSADGCGQPCATDPLVISEILSLGADVFELSVPEEEKNPEPPELTKEEKESYKEEWKELKPKERKEKQKALEEDRKRVAVVKALVERNKFLVSRLHYRYDDKTLSRDPKLAPAPEPVEGGVALPKGEKREVSSEVKGAKENRLQIRYNNFHNWKPVIKCQTPDRYKWGKSPPDYRGLRKTWIAEDLTRKSRTQIKPAEVVKTAVAALGLSGVQAPVDAGADAGADAAQSGKGCGCRTTGGGRRYGAFAAFLAALAALGVRRQRRASSVGVSMPRAPRAAK
jgi:MYXO-CTERM domain-containing protein